MANQDYNCIYLQLAIDLERRILHKQLNPDSPLPSLNQICHRHHVSYKTACKVYQELSRRGIIYSINGKGYFVSSSVSGAGKTNNLEPLQEIVVLDSAKAGGNNRDRIHGMEERAAELNLPVRVVPAEASEKCLLNTSGIVFFYSHSVMRLYQKLGYRQLRVVMINNYFPFVHCVVNDNFEAMHEMMNRMAEYGCRKIFLCSRHYTDLGQASLSEREYAFQLECRQRNLEGKILISGNVDELFRLCGDAQTVPDGIIFGSYPTLLAYNEEKQKNQLLQKPRLMVFGVDDTDFPNVDVWKFSGYEQGKMAVDLLYENQDEDWMLPMVHYAPGSWV